MAESIYNPLAPNLGQGLSQEANLQISALMTHEATNPYATPDASALRRSDTVRDAPSPSRPAFVRDAEKILHLPAYNRLAGKTQVFSFVPNDDLCRRGLHVQLVARIARDIGRALGLNCDLIEAIALGHDLGHTPFGHAGERFLNDVYHARTGKWFLHNVQSVQVIDTLYGRNVSLQVLDGVVCHNGEFECQRLARSDIHDFAGFDQMVADCKQIGPDKMRTMRPMTLEGCVVRLSDIIAYVGKDRQDAIRAHLVEETDFDDGLGGAYNAWALKAFADDVIEHSLGKDAICMSEEGFAELKRAKAENYEKIYRSEGVREGIASQVPELFEELYLSCYEALETGDESHPIFHHHIEPVTEALSHYGKTYAWEQDKDQTVADFISAMTDEYFVACVEREVAGARDVFRAKDRFWRLDARLAGTLLLAVCSIRKNCGRDVGPRAKCV